MGPHLKTCHGCGNIRRELVLCSACPQVFCHTCFAKFKSSDGKEVFANGCPVCKGLCCCSFKSMNCMRGVHCYKKCPTTRQQREGAKTAISGASGDPQQPRDTAQHKDVPYVSKHSAAAAGGGRRTEQTKKQPRFAKNASAAPRYSYPIYTNYPTAASVPIAPPATAPPPPRRVIVHPDLPGLPSDVWRWLANPTPWGSRAPPLFHATAPTFYSRAGAGVRAAGAMAVSGAGAGAVTRASASGKRRRTSQASGSKRKSRGGRGRTSRGGAELDDDDVDTASEASYEEEISYEGESESEAEDISDDRSDSVQANNKSKGKGKRKSKGHGKTKGHVQSHGDSEGEGGQEEDEDEDDEGGLENCPLCLLESTPCSDFCDHCDKFWACQRPGCIARLSDHQVECGLAMGVGLGVVGGGAGAGEEREVPGDVAVAV